LREAANNAKYVYHDIILMEVRNLKPVDCECIHLWHIKSHTIPSVTALTGGIFIRIPPAFLWSPRVPSRDGSQLHWEVYGIPLRVK